MSDSVPPDDESHREPDVRSRDDAAREFEDRLRGMGDFEVKHPQVPGLMVFEHELPIEGGQGIVVRASHAKSGRWVAWKYAKPGMDGPAAMEHRQRLKRESLILDALDHYNIPRKIGDGVLSCGRPYVLTDWVEGCDLSQLPLTASPLDVMRVLQGAMSALAYCHRVGVVHRDVKPSNIRVGEGYTGYLIDFGLGKAIRGRIDQLETAVDSVAGTEAYQSPEVKARGARHASKASDVYAMGKVLEWCSTFLQERGAFGQWQRLIDHATAADPARRYRDGRELLAAFQEWRAGSVVPEPQGNTVLAYAMRAMRSIAVILLLGLAMGSSEAEALDRKKWFPGPVAVNVPMSQGDSQSLTGRIMPSPLGETRTRPDSSAPMPASGYFRALRLIEELEASLIDLSDRPRNSKTEERILSAKLAVAALGEIDENNLDRSLEAHLILRARAYLAGLDSYWERAEGRFGRPLIIRESDTTLNNGFVAQLRLDIAWLRSLYPDSVRVLELEVRFLCALSRVELVRGLNSGGGYQKRLSPLDHARLLECIKELGEYYAPPALEAVAKAHSVIHLMPLDLSGAARKRPSVEQQRQALKAVEKAVLELRKGENCMDLIFLEDLLVRLRIDMVLSRRMGAEYLALRHFMGVLADYGEALVYFFTPDEVPSLVSEEKAE